MPLSARSRALPVVGLALLLTAPVFAQDIPAVSPPAPTANRSRIGLALAGGSAYGESHIGVLKWMEEHHIPVDYIAGTSMGGLVAGAYSCGHTPDELTNLFSSLDWQAALRGDAPYSALSFRRKEDRRAISNRFEFGFKNGLTLPGGLNPAHAIGLLISDAVYPCSTVKSFDDMPIPFRCVATDLESGEAVVMQNGSLPTALRATMALPGLFTPVRRDGKLLSDGGIVNNLPTQAVLAMGAQTIIAVDLNATPLAKKETKTMETILSIVGRSVTLAVRANERESLQFATVVVAPDLTGISGTDFQRVEDLVARGYAAAEAQKVALLPYALNDAAWQEYLAARTARRGNPPVRPAFLTVTGPPRNEIGPLTQRLRPLLTEPFPSKRADERFTLLTGDGRYTSVLYEGATDATGRQGVRVLAQQKNYGPPFLRAGLEINGADTRNVQVNTVARYIGLDAGIAGAEERIDARLGSNIQLSGEYLVPIGGANSRLFAAPRVFYADNSRNAFQNGTRTAIYGTEEIGGALDLATIPNRFFETRLGFQLSNFRSGIRTGVAGPTTNGTVKLLRLQSTLDRWDDALLPRNGLRAFARGTRYLQTPGADTTVNSVEVNGGYFSSRDETNTLFALASGGTTFGKEAPPPLQFALGGPFRLGSYGVDALRGDDYYLLTAGYLRSIGPLPLIGGRTMIGTWGELGSTFGHNVIGAQTGTSACLSAGIISETILGPFLLGISIGDNGQGGLRTQPYFLLGRVF